MERAIGETARRRQIQRDYNEAHGITPQTIIKAVRDLIKMSKKSDSKGRYKLDKDPESMNREELEKTSIKLSAEMKRAASDLQFELAAKLRDELLKVNKQIQIYKGE
jgi:excinuclease ABC subunit B